MGHRAVLFLGPSEPPEVRPQLSQLTWAGPARRGDVAHAISEGATIIGLIDGELYQNLAVSPAEVREAAKHARIFGGASIGALRALECPAVAGVGEIYELFVRGKIKNDDELVGTWSSETQRTIAWPLVVVRDVLERSSFFPADAARMIEAAQLLSFDQRDTHTLCELARRTGLDAELFRVELLREPNIKQRDARAVIDRVIEELRTRDG